jgi:hypothetical protein
MKPLAYFMRDRGCRSTKKTYQLMAELHPNLVSNSRSQQQASLRQRFLAFFQIAASGQKSVRFISGTVLIAGSFLVYLAYPLILLFLPSAGSIKVAATVAAWVISWGIFSAGIYLTGPEGSARLKALWTRMTGAAIKNPDTKELPDQQR